MNTQNPLIGLNLYRAFAIVLMVVAHASRLQTNLRDIRQNSELAGFCDQLVLFVLRFEPAISAMFLFIAGFSLVLSNTARSGTQGAWLHHQGIRALQLYGIAILFFIGDEGMQWPDVLVSPGILSVIAVALLVGAICMIQKHAMLALGSCTVLGVLLTLTLERMQSPIPGLYAGAGGMFPLVTLTWLGAMVGLARQRWPQHGLQVCLAISLVVGGLALVNLSPWTTHPLSTVRIYPGERATAVLYSLQDAFGLYNGQAQLRSIAYWNHAAIFVPRSLPFLILALAVFLYLFRDTPITGAEQSLRQKSAPNFKQRKKQPLKSKKTSLQESTQQTFAKTKCLVPAISLFNRLGSQALNVYILHLTLLAPFALFGMNPTTGWQTLALTVFIIGFSLWLLRFVSIVPPKINCR
ncbi:hypothetical protein HDN1F_10020 [gamma proteobacterium HdN1]|nr:hypothetical protein HDN1F_10020 [gamma proteobacterium HdN1]